MDRKLGINECHNGKEEDSCIKEINIDEIAPIDVEEIKALKHVVTKSDQDINTTIKETKTEGILETIKSQKPSKKLSEIALRNNISSDPFLDSQMKEDDKFLKILSTGDLSKSFQKINKKKKSPEKLKAYKNFFIALFESVLIMKKIEPLTEADLAIRTLSIPRPTNITCNL